MRPCVVCGVTVRSTRKSPRLLFIYYKFFYFIFCCCYFAGRQHDAHNSILTPSAVHDRNQLITCTTSWWPFWYFLFFFPLIFFSPPLTHAHKHASFLSPGVYLVYFILFFLCVCVCGASGRLEVEVFVYLCVFMWKKGAMRWRAAADDVWKMELPSERAERGLMRLCRVHYHLNCYSYHWRGSALFSLAHPNHTFFIIFVLCL